LFVTASSYLVCVWHGARVVGFRKPAGISYPNAYASSEAIAAAKPEKKQAMYLFNCAQRAHQNFLENYPIALTGMLLSGLRYPIAAAATGAVWTASRLFYAIGYTDKTKEGGKGRYNGGIGSLFWACQLAFTGMVAKAGFDLVMA
jgi:glutathione S-transferase